MIESILTIYVVIAALYSAFIFYAIYFQEIPEVLKAKMLLEGHLVLALETTRLIVSQASVWPLTVALKLVRAFRNKK